VKGGGEIAKMDELHMQIDHSKSQRSRKRERRESIRGERRNWLVL